MLRRYFSESAALGEIGGAAVNPATAWKKLRATVKSLPIGLNGQPDPLRHAWKKAPGDVSLVLSLECACLGA